MTNMADAPPQAVSARPPQRRSFRDLVLQTEINFRLFGMLVALAMILLIFHLWSGGTFLRPENMMSLAVQASGIAVISTGMVLVIVSRNIDLSVGSVVGIVAMTYAVLMTDVMPNVIGMAGDFPFRWLIALGMGMGLGLTITRRVVTSLGGSIQVQSQRGAGARFVISVPRLLPREHASSREISFQAEQSP